MKTRKLNEDNKKLQVLTERKMYNITKSFYISSKKTMI